MATWRSGDAADCKSVYAGSIPAVASNDFLNADVSTAAAAASRHRPEARVSRWGRPQ